MRGEYQYVDGQLHTTRVLPAWPGRRLALHSGRRQKYDGSRVVGRFDVTFAQPANQRRAHVRGGPL